MTRTARTTIATLAALFTIGFVVTETSGQEKQKFSFVAPPGVSTYTQQHEIEVGDVPGHRVRFAPNTPARHPAMRGSKSLKAGAE